VQQSLFFHFSLCVGRAAGRGFELIRPIANCARKYVTHAQKHFAVEEAGRVQVPRQPGSSSSPGVGLRGSGVDSTASGLLVLKLLPPGPMGLSFLAGRFLFA
jgi:hypothetical protein